MAFPPLAIQLLGPLRVTVHGEPLPRVRTRSVEWLLALLTLRHGRAVSRAWLAGTLWPESSQSRGLKNLRNDLVDVRKALGPEGQRLQSPARDLLTLDLAGAEVDVVRFDAAIQAGDDASLREAVSLYTGPLLEGCVAEWVLPEREARAEQCLTALVALAEGAERRGDLREAIRSLRRAEGMDPLRDSTQRGLMRLLAASGDAPAALLAYREYRDRLHREMSGEPDAQTRAVFAQIRAQTREKAAPGSRLPAPSEGRGPTSANELPASQPGAGSREPGAGRAATPHSLPHPMTALIGREEEVEKIVDATRRSRLVTLVGGGGVGKTRLAIQVAAELADTHVAEGYRAAFVELAPLSDPTLLRSVVAAALGLYEEASPEPRDLLQAIIGWLSLAPTLLVLDNCEHLVEAAAELAQRLLAACPELRVLAASRQRLGLTGEIAWRVPSLASPDPERLPGEAREAVVHVLQFPAAQLFVERATAVRPGFRLDRGEDAAAVARICSRLDGIPLALELAAARVKVLEVSQIAARLDDRFRLLTGGSRAALPRHQTLRALIDWSCDGLPAAEAALLRRLSVFAGGWTLEAAEAVGSRQYAVGSEAGSSSLPTAYCLPPTENVLDLLDALVDRSLVLVEETGQGLRYRMLETVREYAREKLEASGERKAVRDQHRDWYLQLARRAADAADRPEEREWRPRMERELENFRAALRACHEAADQERDRASAEAGLKLCGSLARFWVSGGYLTEGLDALETALADGADLPAALRSPALDAGAYLAAAGGQLRRAAIFRQQLRLASEQVLESARAQGREQEITSTLLTLAHNCYWLDDLDAAWAYGLEARLRISASGDRFELSRVLTIIAEISLRRGNRAMARALLEERLATCRTLGNSAMLVHALGGMGHLDRDEGHYGRARAYYRESLLLRRELGDTFALAQSLEDFALLAGREGDAERSIRLLGACEAYCETIGALPPVADAAGYERTVAAGRAALDEARFAAAWAAGRTLSLEQAVEYALGKD